MEKEECREWSPFGEEFKQRGCFFRKNGGLIENSRCNGLTLCGSRTVEIRKG